MSGIASSTLYAQADAKIPFSRNKPGSREDMITRMEISGTGEAEDRIVPLEQKVRNMDALVRGLVAEPLDLKTVFMAVSRQDGERGRKEPGQGTGKQDTAPELTDSQASPSVRIPAEDATVIHLKGVNGKDVPDAAAGPAMARIMQADGTMKMEPRYGDRKTVDSSAGNGRTRKGAPSRDRQDSLS